MNSEVGSILEFQSDVTEVEAPKALPASDYPAEITAAEVEFSRTSNRRQVKVTFRIKPEDFPADYEDAESFADGKDINHWVPAESDRASMFRLRRFIEAIGAPGGTSLDVNEWIGKTASVSIEPNEFEGIERERIRKVEAV